MRAFSRLVAIAVACVLSTVPLTRLAAQRLGPHAARPKLRNVPDTNDSQAYFDAGIELFRSEPWNASAAFYWAARLNPGSGDALYARRAALLAQDRSLLANMLSGNNRRRLRSNAARTVDSLQFRALMLNPFLYRRLDSQLFIYYINDGKGTMDTDLTYALNSWLMSAPPVVRGWFSYGEGNFPLALKRYAEALSTTRDKASVRLERARIFGMRNMVDSSVAEFELALDELRDKDEKDLVEFYNSKAQAEYSIATLLEGAGKEEEARQSYGRALQEDLAYYPAHLRLGLLALSLKDTATAVSELALAAQIASEEPFVRYMNGYVLNAAGKHPESIAELEKSIQLEPYFALPSLILAVEYERLEKGPEAVAAFKRFLSLASARDPQRPIATQRLRELEETIAAMTPKP